MLNIHFIAIQRRIVLNTYEHLQHVAYSFLNLSLIIISHESYYQYRPSVQNLVDMQEQIVLSTVERHVGQLKT